MIRLTTSCDICGAEKKQTNHWFVAYEQNGELRISGWKSRFTKKSGSHHLCGQTCLHKLVDEFMAKTIEDDRAAAEPGLAETAESEARRDSGSDPHNDPRNGARNDVHAQQGIDMRVDHRLPDPRWIENRAHGSRAAEPHIADSQSSASSWSGGYEDEFGSSARLIPTPPASDARPALHADAGSDDPSRYASQPWRASAWERERERSLRSDSATRRHKI